ESRTDVAAAIIAGSAPLMFLSPARGRGEERGLHELSQPPLPTSPPSGGEEEELMAFFLEVLIGGLLAGGLYSLVALGFVLIFKASGVFNFAQGAMVLMAALALVRALDLFEEWHWPFGLALAAAFAFAAVVMAVVAWAAEYLVLRKLVNQEGIILFMATIGVTFFIEGLAQTVFGADV